MPLSAEEVEALVGELAEPLSGARVEKVQARSGPAVVLALRPAARGEGEDARIRKVHLLLSARPGFARAHVVEERGPLVEPPPPFVLLLRERIGGAKLLAVRHPGRERAVELDLEPPRPRPAGGTVREERPRPARLILVAELAGRTPNLLLLDASRRLIDSLVPPRRQGGGGEIPPGDRYLPPGRARHPRAMAGVAASPWRYLPREAQAGAAEPEGPLERRFPLNLALGRYYARAEAESLLDERRRSLEKRLAAALAKIHTLAGRLASDLEGARAGEGALRLGELLKAELHRIRRGASEVEVVDYYREGMPRVVVPLDPALDPRANVERYFQRYRKSQRAVPLITARIERVEAEAARLEELKAALAVAEGPQAVEEIERRAGPLLGKAAPPPRAKRAAGEAEARGPRPRRFVSRDGITILVGRTARENDELTFRMARGNDVFLHVSGRPGPHVVVRREPGTTVPLETLLDAAQLALYYSLPSQKRAPRSGAAADVDYAEVKHVRKPRGAPAGEVLLARRRTLRVALEEGRLARLREGEAAPPGPATAEGSALTPPGEV